MDKVLILFSGGVDSTAVTSYYLQKGYKVQLITFDNGAEKGLDKPEHKANLIKRQFGEQCSWKLLECTFLFHEIAIKNLEQDIRKYGNLICCGCKLAMLSEAIIFCKRHEIKMVADGFERGQIYYPEQTPEYISVANSFAKKYNISYLHPIYEMNSKQIEDLTFSIGISTESEQADCLFGLNRVKNKNIRKYTQLKLPIARQYIKKASGNRFKNGRKEE